MSNIMSEGSEYISEGSKSLKGGLSLNIARLMSMISLALVTALGCGAPHQDSMLKLKNADKNRQLACLLDEFNRRALLEGLLSDWARKNCDTEWLAEISGDLSGVKEKRDELLGNLGLDGLVKWTGGDGTVPARQGIDCGVFSRLPEESKAHIENPGEIDSECGFKR